MKYSFAVLALTAASVNAIKLRMDLERMTNQADNVLMQFKHRHADDDGEEHPEPQHYAVDVPN